MNILDLDNVPLSDRNGSYGGAAGSKEGVLLNDQYWLIKYPKSTRSMKGDLTSYTTAPLSEYIGSHVYGILGYDVHETVLGIRNGKLVVACKDFCASPGELREVRTLKNTYNEKLESILECELDSTGDAHSVDLREILIHLTYNPILSCVPDLKERFWDLVLIDGLINNNDRNNGNWGLIYRNNMFSLAPIYDNGAAFSNKSTDAALCKRLGNAQAMEASALNTVSVYSKDGKLYPFRKLLQEAMQYSDFRAAVQRNVPLIAARMEQIQHFMNQIPASCQGVYVCSPERRAVYMQGMQLRFEKLLVPALEQVVALEAQLQAEKKTAHCNRESTPPSPAPPS